jgi:hypothetical protein
MSKGRMATREGAARTGAAVKRKSRAIVVNRMIRFRL